uniref:MAK10-like protein n=1 Tax=Tanacetum cinerariifolium TaxID=118510 RepID=A0A6L2M567_TANCI|nr:hypothetical protein [Tanacetum cinerariifolium]
MTTNKKQPTMIVTDQDGAMKLAIEEVLTVGMCSCHTNIYTARNTLTIDQSTGGKIHDKNTEESWAPLEDLAFYDNESWNDPRDFAKPVKPISLPQDTPSIFYRYFINLENQVQRLMEAHPAPKSSIQVNKIASLCKICSGLHDTQYCMENPEQAFVNYASSRIDEAGWLVYNFMASQDARLSKFEADFKQQQVLSARSYPMEDPQCSSRIYNSINAIKTCSKQTTNFQNDQPKVKTLTIKEIGTPKLKEPEQTLEDEFKDLHLNLPVLEVLAHALMYNAILDKYVESLELGKNRSAFIQGEMPKKMKDPRLFTLTCRLGKSKPFDTLANLGSCVNLIPLYLFKKLKM